MKKLLLCLVSCLFLLSAKAQVPFPMDGAIWVNTEYTYTFNPPNPIPFEELNDVDNYCVNGQDTTIEGNDYTQVFYCGDAYKGAIRDDNGIIYFVPADSTDEYLLYDFTAQENQTLQNVYVGNHNDESFMLQDFTVQQIGTEVIGGVTRRVVWADNFRWIEGIGCETGLFMEPWTNVSMYAVFLECMSVNGQRLFPTEGNEVCPLTVGLHENDAVASFEIYPNPTAGSLTISFNDIQSEVQISIVNAYGQSLKSFTATNSDKVEMNFDGASGVYFAIITTANGARSTLRLVKN